MFFTYRRWHFGLAVALMAACCVLIHIRRHPRLEKEPIRPFGQFTQAQITRRTEPLLHLMAPGKDDWMGFSRGTYTHRDGSVGHYWAVDCLNGAGPDATQVGFFGWDADTGDLVTASYHAPVPGCRGNHSPLSERQAVEQSWHWLQAFGFAKAGSRWHCDRAARLRQDAWSLHWQSREQNVTMHLDSETGRFRFASVGTPPGRYSQRSCHNLRKPGAGSRRGQYRKGEQDEQQSKTGRPADVDGARSGAA
jgi:hypothetical protein